MSPAACSGRNLLSNPKCSRKIAPLNAAQTAQRTVSTIHLDAVGLWNSLPELDRLQSIADSINFNRSA